MLARTAVCCVCLPTTHDIVNIAATMYYVRCLCAFNNEVKE